MKLTRIALALAAIAAFSPAWAAPGTAPTPTSGTTATPTGDKATTPTDKDKDKTAPMDKTGTSTTSTTTTTTASGTQPGMQPATGEKGMETQPGMAQPGMQAAGVDKGIELPAAADRLRAKGVPEGEVTKVLNSAKSDKIPAADAAVMVDKLAQMPMPADKAALNDFGSVVKEQLDAGLRGDALVTAVKSKLEVEKAQDQMKNGQPGMAPAGTTQPGMAPAGTTPPASTTPATKPAPAPVDKNPEHK